MSKIIIFFLLYLSISIKNETITNGIYEIKYKDQYLSYQPKKNKFYLSNKPALHAPYFFRIKNILNNKNISFFLLENLNQGKKIYSENNEIKTNSEYNSSNDNFLWSIINTKNETSVIIKNKNGCFINISSSYKINCFDSIQEASQFYFIKIYEEVNHSEDDIKLIEKEPIDIVIKYIDLSDLSLNRTGIHQINKDIDNEELRFSIRSILKNIPWIRKIFILMPNEKVRYLKEFNEIKDKIVYIKDKDLIGFDSSSSLVFQFRYWKLKEFNLSDNFISMDDDCYIGRPLKKADLFYVENQRVVPLIISSKFLQFNEVDVKRNINNLKRNIKKSKKEQTFSVFQYSKYLTYSFIMKSLSTKKIIVPKFTHNAIPTNINEIKEIFDLINQSEYRNATLYSNYRHIDSLQFQTFVLSYTFIKHKKKIKNISHRLIKFGNSLIANYDYDLFCVNTNAIDNSNLSKQIFKIVMEKIFPEKSPYEIIDYNLSSFAFDVIKQIKTRADNLERELNKNNQKKIKIDALKNQNQNLTKVLIQYQIKLKENLSQNRNNLFIFFGLILVLISKIVLNFFYIHLFDI